MIRSVLAGALAFSTTIAAHAAIPDYTLVGSFPLPRSSSFVPTDPFDVLPDGRIIQMHHNELWLQSGVNASTYALAGSLPAGAVSSIGPSFIRVSPDGTRLAIGDNNFTPASQVVHVVDLALLDPLAPTTPSHSVPSLNFDAHWTTNSSLLITGGDFFVGSSVVTRLDLAPSPTTTVVIDGIGAGSGGIVSIGSTIYVGVGFGFGNTPTGQVRSFDLATISGTNSPIPFESASILTQTLSAFPLSADSLGNLLIGGGDSFASPPLLGYAVVMDPTGSSNPLLLSPAGPDALYSVGFNAFTNELLVIADGIAYRYAIPAPGSLAVILFAIPATRRRRRARRTESR
ncbi:MAG: hypothetical protein KF768_07270 [Phycisphaeraceae bacterium]|nr:hypothetical protein [Phycisphaeraceae bacterium]